MKVAISPQLHDYFVREARSTSNQGTAKLYLIGANSHGTCVEKVDLKRSGGCSYMPEISTAQITKATLRIYKKGLVPAAFVRTCRIMTNPEWGGNSGHALWDQIGIPFVSYLYRRTTAQVGLRRNKRQTVSVVLRDADWTPRPKVTKKKATKVTKSKVTKSKATKKKATK